jgi:outer membrane immunogenic protein
LLQIEHIAWESTFPAEEFLDKPGGNRESGRESLPRAIPRSFHMRRLASALLATSSLVVFAGDAPAADLPLRMVTKAPAAAPAYYNWTGCYVGGHVGGGWGRKDVASGELGFVVSPFAGFDDDVDGFLGGVQAGCNYQINPTWVVGIESQFSWSDIKGSFSRNPFIDPFVSGKGPNVATFSARTDWIGTLTGRIGYTWNRWMLYGKLGAAWVHDKYTLVGDRPFSFSGSETRTGWMLGVGFEYAFTGNWSAKLEYNYLDFGSRQVRLPGFESGGNPANPILDIDQQLHVVKVGLNYRFWPGVATRY